MDAPGWHPSNGNSKKDANVSTVRTEYKLMKGSEADSSTEEGRNLLEEMVRGVDGGGAAYEGRGFFDTSDRLYLIEQKRLEYEKQIHQSREQEEALQEFRTGVMKAQAQKLNAVSLFSSSSNTKENDVLKSTSAAPLILVKAKKRVAEEMKNTKQKIKKDTKLSGETILKSSRKKRESLSKKKQSLSSPVGLVHYSSSEEDE